MANTRLQDARNAKNDEFYTHVSDIARECSHYKEHFRGKAVLCNCDDPYSSDFFKYFALSFDTLQLKRLITTCCDDSPIVGTQMPLFKIAGMRDSTKKAYLFDTDTFPDINQDGAADLDDAALLMEKCAKVVRPLAGNGDFRSEECIELLKQADVVVTNPPFSLFREYIAQLVEYGKKFLIIGHQNAITYKGVFQLIKDNQLWTGYNNFDSSRFIMPAYYDVTQSKYAYEENGIKYGRVSGLRWFTNIDHKKRHEKIILYKRYTPSEYPTYDNYDAIEVSKVSEIPADYEGVMGVPVTFLDKYNPDQFEILGNLGCYAPDGYSLVSAIYIKGKKIFKRIAVRRKGA